MKDFLGENNIHFEVCVNLGGGNWMHIRNQNIPKCVPWSIRSHYVTLSVLYRTHVLVCLFILYFLSLLLKYNLHKITGSSGLSGSLPLVHSLK